MCQLLNRGARNLAQSLEIAIHKAEVDLHHRGEWQKKCTGNTRQRGGESPGR